jgi:hypothetical protein
LTVAEHVADCDGIAGVEFGHHIAELREFVPQVFGDDGVERLARAASAGVVEGEGKVGGAISPASRKGAGLIDVTVSEAVIAFEFKTTSWRVGKR